ncbi:MAG: UMP kinase [Candidatus Hodarchaeota archaeon]
MKLVVKIGGSLLFEEGGKYNPVRFKEYAQVIRKIKSQGDDLALVVGGGSLAKALVETGRILGGDHDALDYLGIAATWVSAQLMITALGKMAYPTPIMNEEQLAALQQDERVLVLGGFQPRQSTNAVAARVAELIHSNLLINVTDVEGVYDRDPKESDQAKLLPLLTVKQLMKIISSLECEPGTYPLFDKQALEIIQRARIEVWFVNGIIPSKIIDVLETKKPGTRLVSS